MDLLTMLNPVEDEVSVSGPVSVPEHTEDAAAANMLLLLGDLAPEAAHSTISRLQDPCSCANSNSRPVTPTPLDSNATKDACTPMTATLCARRSPRILPLPSPEFHLSPVTQKLKLTQKQKQARRTTWKDLDDGHGNSLLCAPPRATSTPAQPPAICSVVGCHRAVAHHRKCALHKCMKFCQVTGCTRPVQSRGVCKSHGGGARCKFPGCSKGAISKNRCRTHGGGTRCAIPDCLKWAQRFGYCVRHSKILVRSG